MRLQPCASFVMLLQPHMDLVMRLQPCACLVNSHALQPHACLVNSHACAAHLKAAKEDAAWWFSIGDLSLYRSARGCSVLMR